jgi:hypothetical protein
LRKKCTRLTDSFVEEDKPNIPIEKEEAIISILKVIRSIWDSLLDGVGEAAISAASIGAI